MKNYRVFFVLSIALLLGLAAIPASTANVFAQRPTKGTPRTVNKKNPIPKNWDYIYDQKKGYGFYVPSSSVAETKRVDGVDVMIINTGAATDISRQSEIL